MSPGPIVADAARADAARAILREVGYELFEGEIGPGIHVAVGTLSDVRWVATQDTRVAALEALIGELAGAPLARRLLERAILKEVGSEQAGPERTSTAAGDGSPRASVVQMPAEAAPRERVVASVVASRAAQVPAAATPAPPRRPGPPPKDPTPAMLRLADLLDEIDEQKPDLAQLAPELQRAKVRAWICQARGIQELYIGDELVEQRTGEVAGALGGLMKRWWPGSVSALQRVTVPADLGPELGLPPGSPRSWVDAGERAARVFEQMLQELGPDGWGDEELCEPAPRDPEATFYEARGLVETVLGPPGDTSISEMVKGFQAAGSSGMTNLLRAVSLLRWIRPHVEDTEAWADLLGVIRSVERRISGRDGRLGQHLDPAFRPNEPWPRVCGYDPDKRQRQRRRKELLQGPPSPNGPPDGLMAWLEELFGFQSEMPTEKLAEHVQQFRLKGDVLGLPIEACSSRSARSRLRRLQETLDPSLVVPDVDDDDDDDDDHDGEDGRPSADELLRELAAVIRPSLDGRPVLFLTNRVDPITKERLEALLDVEVDWAIIDQRRRQAAEERVRGGRYSAVITATRFVGHDVDHALNPIATAQGIPYVRAGAGRAAGVLRALAHALGLKAVA